MRLGEDMEEPLSSQERVAIDKLEKDIVDLGEGMEKVQDEATEDDKNKEIIQPNNRIHCRICKQEFYERDELQEHIAEEHDEYFNEHRQSFTAELVIIDIGIQKLGFLEESSEDENEGQPCFSTE